MSKYTIFRTTREIPIIGTVINHNPENFHDYSCNRRHR